VALSNKQIERYSRQIIVPGVGGTGQERLLAAHLVIVGEFLDVEPVFAYMVGAGVGRISLVTTGTSTDFPADLVELMREHNPDVAIESVTVTPADAQLLLGIVGSAGSQASVRAVCDAAGTTAIILARLDEPPKIAVIPSPPPCIGCIDADLFTPFSSRSVNAGAIVMMAATEAFKFLAGQRITSRPIMLEFDGYKSSSLELCGAADCPRCGNHSDQTGSRR
jgi:hypothetical protein